MSAPAIVLVRPQLGWNIGAAARAMANFGLSDLRLVAPRDGWPNPAAEAMAADGLDVLRAASLFDDVAAAIADLGRVWAATARRRAMAKPEQTARAAGGAMAASPSPCGVLFGPEASGLANDEVALADTVLRVPAQPGRVSINLAQAVLLVAYERFQAAAAPAPAPQREPPAAKGALEAFFSHLLGELDRRGFLRSPQARGAAVRHIRAMFQRASLSEREVATLRGIVACLARPQREKRPGGGERSRGGEA